MKNTVSACIARNWVRTIALLLIIAGGALLRLAGLTHQGLLLWDEGGYLLEARYWIDGLHDLPALIVGRANGAIPYYGKPTHVAFVAVALHLLGHRAYAGQVVSALFGVLSIVLVFALGWRLFGRKAAFFSALLFAVLPYHVMYSRTALPEADSTFLYYLGIYLWLLSRTPTTKLNILPLCLLAGGFVGLAATANYPLWPLVAVLPAMELLFHLLGDSRASLVLLAKRFTLIIIGITLPFAFWQGLSGLLSLYAARDDLALGIPSYVGQLRGLLFGERLVDLRNSVVFSDPSFYVRALWMFSGPLVLGLTLGMGLTIFSADDRRRLQSLVPLILFIVPILFFTAYPAKALRQIAISLPAEGLLAGTALSILASKLTSIGRMAMSRVWGLACSTLLVGIVLLNEAWVVLPIVGSRSGFEEAVNWLHSRGVHRYLSTQPSICAFYEDSVYEVRGVPCSAASLWSDWQDGYRYVLIDEQAYVAGCDPSFIKRLERELPLVLAVDDPYKTSPIYFLEQDPARLSFEAIANLFRTLRSQRGDPQVRVYEITSEFAATLPQSINPLDDPEVSASSRQLLLNPSFEHFDRTGPTGWQAYGRPIFDVSGKHSHSGLAAVRTRGDGNSGYTQVVPVSEGNRYLLSEWIRSDRDQLARVQVNWLDSQGAGVSSNIAVVPSVRDWRQRWISVVAPARATQAVIYVSIQYGGEVWFDDFSFVEIKEP